VRGRRSREVEYLLTSLSRERATPADLLRLRRAHWGVENRLFCVRDVSYREDQCRVRSGAGPEALAALRNTAITILRRLAPNVLWTYDIR
jgi:predicted transposase YbfD/YdcC